jgi:hypothetical protein
LDGLARKDGREGQTNRLVEARNRTDGLSICRSSVNKLEILGSRQLCLGTREKRIERLTGWGEQERTALIFSHIINLSIFLVTPFQRVLAALMRLQQKLIFLALSI